MATVSQERDCNTCRWHTQGKNRTHVFVNDRGNPIPSSLLSVVPAERVVDCTMCLCDLVTTGELTQWEPIPDPNNIEA